MAKVTLNPAFESFSGHIGNIIFYERYKNMYARVYVTPRNPDTEKQRANRNLFRDAMNEWKHFSHEEKYRYTKRSRRLPMTGHKLFISEYMNKHLADKDIEESDSMSKKVSNSIQLLFSIYSNSRSLRPCSYPAYIQCLNLVYAGIHKAETTFHPLNKTEISMIK